MNHRISDAVGLPSFLSNADFREASRDGAQERLSSGAVEQAGFNKANPDRLGTGDLEFVPGWRGLSQWSGSTAKRMFDCACVLFSAPIVLPLMLLTALAVRLTSKGPVFFLQERMGSNGRAFTIFKFRNMIHAVGAPHFPIATPDSDSFTPVGRFLRRWKLDEIPQLINVLLGNMSLVGPRPKMREHVRYDLPCRPGITGMATMVFACEEEILASVAKDQLEKFFHAVVLPAKRQLDAEYMSRATFLSDLGLIVKSVLRRWDSAALREIVVAAASQLERNAARSAVYTAAQTTLRRPIPLRANQPVDAEEASVV
jgi:lipopolysaccharide/colanic/teichoic acid biosynthesis glycosyltransferase